MGVISNVAEGFVSGMMTTQKSEKRIDSYVSFLAGVLSFIISLVILAFVGKMLWNSAVTDLFTCVKPAKSIWHILGLMIFVSLVFP